MTLIDIGVGTGLHAKFFQEQGIDVTCVDLSPAHGKKCTEKGLKPIVLHVLDLDHTTGCGSIILTQGINK